jgi:hypothetical protein
MRRIGFNTEVAEDTEFAEKKIKKMTWKPAGQAEGLPHGRECAARGEE